MTAADTVLEAVARRLREDPQRVLPMLRLIADPDAVAERQDGASVTLARRVNAERIAARLEAFRDGAVPTVAVRQLLGGISRQAVAARVATGTLLSLEIGGTSHFPDWQFGPDGPLPHLGQVIGALTAGGRGALAADALMRTLLPEEDGRSPAQLLAEGDVERVLHYVGTLGGGF